MRRPSPPARLAVTVLLLTSLAPWARCGDDDPSTADAPAPLPAAAASPTDGLSETGVFAGALPPPDEGPWTLQKAMGLPSWFELKVEQRTRFEALKDEFRVGPLRDDNQLWALRTLVEATVRGDHWRVTTEIQDSRAYGSPDRGFISPGIVNTLEPLQAFVAYRTEDTFMTGDVLDVKAGRQTLDIGSRRLVARNRYRNTINGFTGVHAEWTSPGEDVLRAFAVVPQLRRPLQPDELRDNERELDDEAEKTRLYGVHGSTPALERSTAEGFVYVLDERDSGDVQTRDRELTTFGARFHTPPRPGEVSFEWETAIQVGQSRSNVSPTNTTDLTHQAHFHHLSVGYEFRADSRPLLEFLFDYASGDRDPGDSANNRFDTLYGARRFDFGPTDIYGAFARSNLISPGVRFWCEPTEDTQFAVAVRQGWLASRKDAWVGSGLRDPTGDSGRDIGQLAEMRLRYDVVPRTFQLEFGLAHLFAGDFVRDAPNNTGQGDSTYAYASTRLRF